MHAELLGEFVGSRTGLVGNNQLMDLMGQEPTMNLPSGSQIDLRQLLRGMSEETLKAFPLVRMV